MSGAWCSDRDGDGVADVGALRGGQALGASQGVAKGGVPGEGHLEASGADPDLETFEGLARARQAHKPSDEQSRSRRNPDLVED